MDEVTLTLSRAEAIVLFEWLARLDDRAEPGAGFFEHSSEERVMWAVSSQLERTLGEPFEPNYRAILESARASLASEQSR